MRRLAFYTALFATLAALHSCAALVERNALVKAPGHYEDNSIFLTIDGKDVECRKDITRPNDPYHMVNGQPTFCRPSNQWPDGGAG